MNKKISRLDFEDIYFQPINEKNIDLGWLSWMNNPKMTRYIAAKKKKKYYRKDLKKYLASHKSYVFFACYRKKDKIYIGNLRIYQYSPNTVSYGLLIDEKYQRRGYGTKFCKVALDLIFNWFRLDLVVATNRKENIAPASYKKNLGFKIVDKNFIFRWKLGKKVDLSTHNSFYMDKKTYYKLASSIYK